MKKRIFAFAIAATLAVALIGCEVPEEADMGKGNVDPIADYHIADGWLEGDWITTDQGHHWEVDNTNGYSGPIEVSYDGKGTASVDDDEMVLAIVPD